MSPTRKGAQQSMLWREPGNQAVERLMEHRKRLVAKRKERREALKVWRRPYARAALFLLGPMLLFPLVAKGIFALPVALFTWLIFDPLVYYVWMLIRLWLVERDNVRSTNVLRHGPYGAAMFSGDIEWRELEGALAMRGYRWREIMYKGSVPTLVRDYLRSTHAVRTRIHLLNDHHSHGSKDDIITLRKAAVQTATKIADALSTT